MYNKIEKEYKKNNPYRSFFIFYWGMSFVVFLICSLLIHILKIGESIVISLEIIMIIIGLYAFIIKETKKYEKTKKV